MWVCNMYKVGGDGGDEEGEGEGEGEGEVVGG